VNRSAPDSPPPLSPDDPRISEWIDGRLPDHEAAEVSRAVRASAELSRVVDDLHAVKAMVARIESSRPPAGFVRDVMEAIESPSPSGDDAAVVTEWRKLEAERVAEERAEALENAIEPVAGQRRPPWPWLALLGALAAGVLVAVGLNPPASRRARDVALAPASPVVGDAGAAVQPDEGAATATVPAAAAVAEQAAAHPAEDANAPGLAAEEIEVVLESPGGRAAVERLLTESGIELPPTGRAADTGRAGAAADRRSAADDQGTTDRESDRIEVIASPEAIEAFLAAIDRREEGRPVVRLGGRRPLEDLRQVDRETRKLPTSSPFRRLVIRVVIGDPELQPGPAAGPPPGSLEE